MNKLKGYKKTIAAVFGAVMIFSGAVILSPAEAISASEWYTLAGGLGTALGVYQVSNEPN